MRGIQDTDVILVQGQGLLARAISWFQREPSEPAICNHAGLAFFMTRCRHRDLAAISHAIPPAWVGQSCTIEALWQVRINLWENFLLQNQNVTAGRRLRLSPGGQERIVRLALTYAA